MQKGLNTDLGQSGTVTRVTGTIKQEQKGFVWAMSPTSAGPGLIAVERGPGEDEGDEAEGGEGRSFSSVRGSSTSSQKYSDFNQISV